MITRLIRSRAVLAVVLEKLGHVCVGRQYPLSYNDCRLGQS